MRKLIVLIMTSVLATGAVANADDVNVVNDPADYITIGDILEDDETTTATTLEPSYATDDANRKYYIMQADFVSPSKLADGDAAKEDLTFNKASLCLYDPAAAPEDGDVDTLCGSEPDQYASGSLQYGQNRPHEALKVVLGGTVTNAAGAQNKHVVKAVGTGGSSRVLQDTDGENGDDLVSYEVHFALSHATANTTGWKVRALVEYNTPGDEVYYALTDDSNTYDIDAYRTINTQRTQVTYPDVIPGEASEVTGITTGTYFANHTVSINMEATAFTNGSSETVPFSDAAPAAANEFGLECTLDSTTLFVEGTAADLVSSSPLSSVGGSEAAKALDPHDCTLRAGEGVEPDSYDNSVTIGIGAGS